MTLSINCKDAGDPVCTHTMYGETEEELLKNAKEHGIKEHGYTEETWKDEMSHNLEHFRSLRILRNTSLILYASKETEN